MIVYQIETKQESNQSTEQQEPTQYLRQLAESRDCFG